MKTTTAICIASLLFFTACNNQQQNVQGTALPVTAPSCPLNEHLVQSTLWYENSGEMQALYYQAYHLAHYMLDEKLQERKGKHGILKTPAVIVDVDETVLDNGPFEGKMILDDLHFSDSLWKDWVDHTGAKALPGAVEFLNYAKSKGVEVFYISNRDTSLVDSTMKNLQQLGFPFADRAHMRFKSEKQSTKEPRRLAVGMDYDILLLCGDNLADFSAAFDDRAHGEAIDSVEKYKTDFGDKFIVLPNPMYGDWEKSFRDGKKLDDRQMDSARLAHVEGY